MTEKNYDVRRLELLLKLRREFHRPTTAERNPRIYSRKLKHRKSYLEID